MSDNHTSYLDNIIDPIALTDSYLDSTSWRVKENASNSWSVNGLLSHQAGRVAAEYWLGKIYSSEVANAHRSCDIHLHDLGATQPYCFDKTKEFILASGKRMSFEEAEKIGLKEADVLSIGALNKIETKHATNIGIRGEDDLYQIELEDGTILKGFTKWHEFKTRNRGFVRADELTEEDDIIEFHKSKVRVKPNTLKIWKQNQPVYCMEVEDNHNFFIAEGDKFLCVKNCAGWSIRTLLEEGLNGVQGKINCRPSNHLNSAMQQMINFFGIMAGEWAGAQAFNQIDTCLAPFIKKDNLSDTEIKQCMQSWLYGINVPSRWSGQAPFSNVTLDLSVPESMKDLHPIIGGKKMPFKYGDLQPEIDRFNIIFFDTFMEGDANGELFQYPIPTINITKRFDWNSPVANKLFELDARYGTFYFANFINSDLKEEDQRSMCSVHPDTIIDVELEEDIVEFDGKFYSVSEARELNIN